MLWAVLKTSYDGYWQILVRKVSTHLFCSEMHLGAVFMFPLVTQHPIYNETWIISKPQILDISDLYSPVPGYFIIHQPIGAQIWACLTNQNSITTRQISFEYFSCLMFSVNVCSEHSSREWVTIWGRNFTHLHFDLERLKTDKHLRHSWVSDDGKHKLNI